MRAGGNHARVVVRLEREAEDAALLRDQRRRGGGKLPNIKRRVFLGRKNPKGWGSMVMLSGFS